MTGASFYEVSEDEDGNIEERMISREELEDMIRRVEGGEDRVIGERTMKLIRL